MTYYYEALVGAYGYHSLEPLVYKSEFKLAVGSVIRLPYRHKTCYGLLWNKVNKPIFETKELSKIGDLPPLPSTTLELIAWMMKYYPAPISSIIQQFLPSNIVKEPEVKSDKTHRFRLSKLPDLTLNQKNVVDQIGRSGTYLLHGETGSGKTRVYQELAKQTISSGKSVIILSPEIGLSSQLLGNFRAVFGEQVVHIHSMLMESERRAAWVRSLKSEEPLVIVGARSAIFTPLKNVGLIVVDEEHESTYKHEQAPYYDTNKVAGKLASIHKATLVLGSATPLVSDYFISEHKKIPIIKLSKLESQLKYPVNISIVDMRDHNNTSRNSYLSDQFLDAIKNALVNKEQSLVFLNRRGTVRSIICEVCGWRAMCPNCDLPLTYHGDQHILRCHTCGLKANLMLECPVCGNLTIEFRGPGTKALVDILKKFFPDASISRFDTDNLKSERLEQQYQKVRAGDIDILVGTQTLVKGLDLPKLGFVGIVSADTSLAIPDYMSRERLYQLTHQAVGRVGRGYRNSSVIIQTFNPDDPTLICSAQQNWQKFYRLELMERKKFNFPPSCYMLKLNCRRASSLSASQTAFKLANQLSVIRDIEVVGPAPAFQEKEAGKFIWQLVVKSKNRQSLVKIVLNLPSGWSYDLDPISLL